MSKDTQLVGEVFCNHISQEGKKVGGKLNY